MKRAAAPQATKETVQGRIILSEPSESSPESTVPEGFWVGDWVPEVEAEIEGEDEEADINMEESESSPSLSSPPNEMDPPPPEEEPLHPPPLWVPSGAVEQDELVRKRRKDVEVRKWRWWEWHDRNSQTYPSTLFPWDLTIAARVKTKPRERKVSEIRLFISLNWGLESKDLDLVELLKGGKELTWVRFLQSYTWPFKYLFRDATLLLPCTFAIDHRARILVWFLFLILLWQGEARLRPSPTLKKTWEFCGLRGKARMWLQMELASSMWSSLNGVWLPLVRP